MKKDRKWDIRELEQGIKRMRHALGAVGTTGEEYREGAIKIAKHGMSTNKEISKAITEEYFKGKDLKKLIEEGKELLKGDKDE